MIRLAVWANSVGVCRQTALAWANDGRISVTRPATMVVLVDEREPRPGPRRPWHTARAERIERENVSCH